ncbi:MAG: hypothetical protein ACJ0GZ_01290 [Alphaproteobacteria bacterium]|jgi:hypothetical protein
MSNCKLPWGNDKIPEYDDIEKALFKIFTSKDGEILWQYLKHTIIENNSQETDPIKIHMNNGKKILVMHLRNLAQRQVG